MVREEADDRNDVSKRDPQRPRGRAREPQHISGLAQERKRYALQLRDDARASFRAMDGWGAVKSQEDWEQVVSQAAEE